MKFALLSTMLPAAAMALQSPYLSQLNGGYGSLAPPNGVANGVNGVTPQTVGSSGHSHPQQQLVQLWSNQVSVELAASQLYLSASIWFRTRDMDGMAAWMLDESGEERGHGLQILEFAMKKQFPVQLRPLDAPRSDWYNPVQVWEDILHAEQTNTQNLLKLAAIADQCGDYAAKAFLNPFHIEQLEAEDKVSAILAKVRVADDRLLMVLDQALGQEAENEDHH
jgi:ferritin